MNVGFLLQICKLLKSLCTFGWLKLVNDLNNLDTSFYSFIYKERQQNPKGKPESIEKNVLIKVSKTKKKTTIFQS